MRLETEWVGFDVRIVVVRLSDLKAVSKYNVWPAVSACRNNRMSDVPDELSEITRLRCAIDPDMRYYDTEYVYAPRADAERWLAATQTLLADIAAIRRRTRPKPRVSSRWRSMLWMLRHVGRIRRTEQELRDEVLACYRNYRTQAGDLTTYLEAARERRERERREEEERERQERAAAMVDAPFTPVWGYKVTEDGEHREFTIYLPTVEDSYDLEHLNGTGLTVAQVMDALARERSQDEYIAVGWGFTTEHALQEWYRSHPETDVGFDDSTPAVRLSDHARALLNDESTLDRWRRDDRDYDYDDHLKAWHRLTGLALDTHPARPGELVERTWRSHGPSSNYFSPGGFGI